MMQLRIFAFCILVACNSKKTDISTTFDEKCRKLVLNENRINQEYIFEINIDTINSLKVNQHKIKYLGNIITENKDTLKFVNDAYLFGLYKDSPRGNGKFYIYDKNNDLLGFYVIGGLSDVPAKIQNNQLIFIYPDNICNKTTKISFSDSIPKQIFIECKDKSGQLHSYTKIK